MTSTVPNWFSPSPLATTSWFLSPQPKKISEINISTLRDQIEECACRIEHLQREERAAASVLVEARANVGHVEGHMRLLQAQVEAAVVASTTHGETSVPSTIVSLELEALVARTRVVEESLREAQSALKEAQSTHYWYKRIRYVETILSCFFTNFSFQVKESPRCPFFQKT
jgi:hypothetical protein